MKKVKTFLAITFILTWVIAFGLMIQDGYKNPYAIVIIMGCMFMPAIGVILTTIITKGSIKDVWIKPNLKGNIKYYLIAWLLPFLLIILGIVVYYLVFPGNFDGSMSTMINATKEQLSSAGQSIPSDNQLKAMLLTQIATSIFVAPVINFIPCLGEELGWRGYLLPNLLEKFTPLKATIISGVIWGIWHTPMIAMGHNYGLGYPTAPLGGIFAMTIFCIFAGSILSYVTLKTKSCIPAVISHAMINGFAGTGVLFMKGNISNPFIGPMPMGILGGIGIILGGLVCYKIISKMNSKDKLYNY